MELSSILRRYINHQVCVATIGQGKIVGFVATVHDDCVRLTNTMTLSELEDSGWYAQIQLDNDEARGPRYSESIIHFHGILSVTCLDEGIHLADESESLSLAAAAAPTRNLVDLQPSSMAGRRHALTEDDVESALDCDLLSLTLGAGLVRLADEGEGLNLLDRITRARQAIAASLGFLMPKVRVRDDDSLAAETYVISLAECEIARGEVRLDHLLAMHADLACIDHVNGIVTGDPTFGIPAKWIAPTDREQVERAGCLVVEPDVVIATHLTEVVEQHAAELLTYDQVSRLVRRLQGSSPVAVEEVLPHVAPISTLHYVLRRLLEERVAIRQLRTIVEALGQITPHENDPEEIVRQVRVRLGRIICAPYQTDGGRLRAWRLSGDAERQLSSAGTRQRIGLIHETEPFAASIRQQCMKSAELHGGSLPLIVDDAARAGVWKLLNRQLPRIAVLAYAEVPPDISIHIAAELECPSVDPFETDPLSASPTLAHSLERLSSAIKISPPTRPR